MRKRSARRVKRTSQKERSIGFYWFLGIFFGLIVILGGTAYFLAQSGQDVLGIATSSASLRSNRPSLFLPASSIEMKPGTTYSTSAILMQNNQIVMDVSSYTYNWKISNTNVATISPQAMTENTGCIFGIQPPCPQNYAYIYGKKEGVAVITVTVKESKTGRPVATDTIRVKVTSTPYLVHTPKSDKASVSIRTDNTLFTADGLAITIGNEKYTLTGKDITARSEYVNPNGTNSTELDLEWMQNGKPMRLYFSIEKTEPNSTLWKVSEIRSYDGSSSGDWIYYNGFLGGKVGSAFSVKNVTWPSNTKSATAATITAKSWSIRPYIRQR